MQRRGKLDKDGKKKDGDGKRASGSTGSGSSGHDVKKESSDNNYEGVYFFSSKKIFFSAKSQLNRTFFKINISITDSITSNDAFSDDDESLVFDNLDEADTPEPGDQGACALDKPPSSSAEPPSPHPTGQYPPSSMTTYTPPNQHMSIGQPPPAHMPPHHIDQGPLPPAHLGLHPQLPPHPHELVQNPIDKLYLMQDSYFTQM